MKRRVENIGWAVALEVAPAAIFGSAAAFATATYLRLPQFDPAALGAGIGAFCAALLVLRLFRGTPVAEHPIAEFEPQPVQIEQSSVSELLTQADVAALVDQLAGPRNFGSEPAEELVLDDVLESVEADSRVVRLFEPDGTPGELHTRIERHLRDAPRPASQVAADATQELHDALAALRRSLR